MVRVALSESPVRTGGMRSVLGSDRFDIHLHLERPPLVSDLMNEVEKKARVTTQNQQLIFRGTPDSLSLDKSSVNLVFIKVNGYTKRPTRSWRNSAYSMETT